MDSVELQQSNADNTDSTREPDSGRRTSLKIALLFLVVTIIFYWRLILVHQYSLLLGFEGANQAYAWFNFWVSTVRQGVWPLWDPFTFSGHAFAGEMQTGAFYPLYLIFLIPSRDGLFSPQLYHVFFVLTHALCAWFVYLLAREFRLSTFAGIVAGICFSLGGVLARFAEWPDLLQSGIWLPLILLLLVRALKAIQMESAVAWSALCGLGLAMAVLAGGLHMVIMEGIVIVSAAIFHTLTTKSPAAWTRTTVVVAVSCGFALAGGAVQLFPSAEYSRLALRWIGPTALPATQKIPYNYIGDALWPHGFLGFFLGSFAGASSGEYVDPYMGVLPVLLAIIGIWKMWSCSWVRYLTGLAVAACLYSLGSFSLLHGILYAVTPWLWAAREADRFMYLAGFSLALLAGFGVDALLGNIHSFTWEPLSAALKWVAIACVTALVYPFVIGGGGVGDKSATRSPLISLSLLLILLTYALYRYIVSGHRGPWARFLVISLILFDLSAFDWSPINKITGGANSHDKILEGATQGRDEMARLLSLRGAADFLRSRPGPFRVELPADLPPNIGDMFRIEETMGAGVTIQTGYNQLRTHTDLMNTRYTIRPVSAKDAETAPAVYQDSTWKVYERPNAFPRAWLVHATAVEPDKEKLLARLDASDARRIALIGTPLDIGLDAAAGSNNEQANLRMSPQDKVDVDVHANGRALLVLSELYYPGWNAAVNGRSAQIWNVDGGLRGIVVPDGDSRVSLRYRPTSFLAGFALTSLAFLGGGILSFRLWRS